MRLSTTTVLLYLALQGQKNYAGSKGIRPDSSKTWTVLERAQIVPRRIQFLFQEEFETCRLCLSRKQVFIFFIFSFSFFLLKIFYFKFFHFACLLGFVFKRFEIKKATFLVEIPCMWQDTKVEKHPLKAKCKSYYFSLLVPGVCF